MDFLKTMSMIVISALVDLLVEPWLGLRTTPTWASNKITISRLPLNSESLLEFHIYNVTGQLLSKNIIDAGTESFVINTSTLPASVYIGKLFKNGVMVEKQKLIIQH